ncbi:hypothetical protein ACWEGM_34915, partial [Streptomyces nigra]
MREVNENGPAPADQRATAEAIERGGIGLSVTDLLARVAPGAAPQPEPEPPAPGNGPPSPGSRS